MRKHITLHYFLALLFSVLASVAMAQNPLSLSKAVEKGLRNNFELQINRIETQMASNQLKAAKKERLPQINTSASQDNNFINDRSPTSFVNGFYKDRNFSLGIDGSWVIFDGFQGKINRERYGKLKEISEGKEQLAIENSIYTILLAYYNVLLQKEAVGVARKSLALSIERYEDAQVQENLGKISAYEVIRLENASLIDSSNIVNQRKELDAAIISLNQVMGNSKIVAYNLSDPLKYTAQQYDFKSMKSRLETSNQSLRNRYSNLEVLRLNTETAKKASLPSLSLNTGLSQRFNGTAFPEIPRIKSNTFQYYLRFSANYNLFDGGARKRSVQENELLEQIEYLQIDQIKNNITDNLASAISNYNRQLELVQVNESLIDNMEKSLVIEKDRYTNGFSSALNFRTVQLEYVNAQFTRLQTIYDLLKNEIEILKITGALTKAAF